MGKIPDPTNLNDICAAMGTLIQQEFFYALSINRFQETIRKKRIFLGKSMTITMQSLQNHWKEIIWKIFYVEAEKTRLISHENCRMISFSGFFSVF